MPGHGPAAGHSDRWLEVAWMNDATCADRDDLPWTTDPDQVTAWDLLVMAAVCQDCQVFNACERFAARADVTAGFWAGSPRDPDADCLVLAGPAWASDPVPTLVDLPDLGGAA